MADKRTTIWIKQSTKENLYKLGRRGEHYDEIINRLLVKDHPLKKLKLRGKNLYRSGTEGRPFFLSIAYESAFNRFGAKHCICWFIGRKNYSYWDEEVITKLAAKDLQLHISGKFPLKKVIASWQEIVDEQNNFEKSIKNLDKLSDTRIIGILRNYMQFIKRSWKIGVMIEEYDPDSEGIIEKVLDKYDKTNLRINEFKVLCSPETLTNIELEQIELYKIAAKKEYAKLKDHANKFFWISNSWADAKFLDQRYFRAKITRLEQEGIDFAEEIKKESTNQKNFNRQKTELKNKYKLCKEVKAAIEFFEVMTEWRETRKKYALISNHYLNMFLEELVKRTKVSRDTMFFALPTEINLPLSQEYHQEMIKRKKFCLQYVEDETAQLLTDNYAKEFLASLTVEESEKGTRLYGNVAYPGKVTGKAKIIFTTQELEKMEKGDILIVPCTRPEYVSAMKKAAAILTDEGGITSHAAIVSRELGVPCIVGLRNATDFFSDGDILIVNASHGVVSLKKD